MMTVDIFQLLLIVSIVSLLRLKKLSIPFENKRLEFHLVYVGGIPLISFPRTLGID